MEKRIAYMRMAFDQQQQDLVDVASKSLAYRQDIIPTCQGIVFSLLILTSLHNIGFQPVLLTLKHHRSVICTN